MKELLVSNKLIRFVVCGAVMSAPFFANTASARVNTVTGGASIGTEYYDEHGEQGSDDDYSRVRFTPTVDFTTSSEKDELHVVLSPSFLYDYDSYDTSTQFSGGIDGFNMFSDKWTVGFANNFVYSDGTEYDPNDVSDSGLDTVADDNGRRKYWTNDFQIYSEYVYAEDSSYKLTYVYTKLENDQDDISSDYENYDKFDFSISNDHTFNSFWSLSSSLSYVLGTYNSPSDTASTEDSDIHEYRFTTGLTSTKIEQNAITLQYSYIGTTYDDDTQGNSDINSATLLWQCDYSSVLVFNASSGATYEQTDGFSGRWGWNGGAGFDYTFEKGSLSFSADQRYDSENFTGSTNENGLSRIQEALLNWNYTLLEDTSLGAYVRYVEDRQEENRLQEEIIDTNTWSTGVNVSQRLSKDYSLNFSYSYSDQESERVGDTYTDHYLSLSLSYQSEFFKW